MEFTEHTEKPIQVYTSCVDCLEDPELYRKVLGVLPPARREAAERMKIDSGKRLSAGAGLLMMAAFAEYMHGDIRSFPSFRTIRFETGSQQKPYLPDLPKMHFNLSHSGNRVMCIVGPVEVGCDVEVINPSHSKSVIRCLAESEQKLAKESPVNFFRLWTLKESILKLSGKGLLIPLSSFEVSLEPLSVRQDFLSEPVSLKEYEDPRSLYCYSCAAACVAEGAAEDPEAGAEKAAVLPEKMTEIRLDDLMRGCTI